MELYGCCFFAKKLFYTVVMDPLTLILAFIPAIVVIIFSIILHEVAHGYMADLLGDPTARYAGRLTLNPLPHIDPIGSVALPGILALTGSPFLIGWAKPVPYNPYNLQPQKWGLPAAAGEALVGFAGPLTNIIIAVIAGLLLRFQVFPDQFSTILTMASLSNLSLAILNLIPIPPLDGSKVLKAFLPYPLSQTYANLEGMTYALGPVGLIGVLLLFIYVLSDPASRLVLYLFSVIVGS
jgi:Zn-dependent protease